MINALLVIFYPPAAWGRILAAKRGVLFLLCTYLVPFLVLISAAEAYGLAHWGRWQGTFNRPKNYTAGEAVVIESSEALIYLVIIFAGAQLVKMLGDTFHGRHTYAQAFSTVAYSLAPLLLLRALDIVPVVSPWVGWAIGICFSLGLLYHSVPRIMQPDPPHAFGLFLVSALLLVLVTAVAQFFMYWYLSGHFTRLDPVISALGAKLRFE